MEDTKDRMEWLSVPAFGEWDQKAGGGVTDYSMDFTKIREMRRQHKRDPSRVSMGNEEELLRKPASDEPPLIGELRPRRRRRIPMMRKVVMSYFNCCIGA